MSNMKDVPEVARVQSNEAGVQAGLEYDAKKLPSRAKVTMTHPVAHTAALIPMRMPLLFSTVANDWLTLSLASSTNLWRGWTRTLV